MCDFKVFVENRMEIQLKIKIREITEGKAVNSCFECLLDAELFQILWRMVV